VAFQEPLQPGLYHHPPCYAAALDALTKRPPARRMSPCGARRHLYLAVPN
jgi:hypothetical protein